MLLNSVTVQIYVKHYKLKVMGLQHEIVIEVDKKIALFIMTVKLQLAIIYN